MDTRSGSRAAFPLSVPVAGPSPRSLRDRLSSGWRAFRAGVAFGLFGLGALVLAFVCFPILRLLRGTTREREIRAQYLVHLAFRLFAWLMEGLGLIRVSWIGAERLRQPGPYLVIANHPTLIDAVLLIARMPQADCVAKREVWNNPFLRGVVGPPGYIPNDQGEALVDACVKRLQEGGCLLLFPEGTRSPMGQLGRFRRGAARIALKSGCDIVPVVLTHDPPGQMKGQKWYDVPPRTSRVTLSVEAPISAREYVDHRSTAFAARRLTAAFRALYEERLRRVGS